VRKLQARSALALLAFASATTANAQSQDHFTFDQPAETLSQALRDVAVRTGRNVIAPSDLVGTQQAAPLSGTFTAEEAVARLLAGTGLRYRTVDGTLVVERAPFADEVAPAPGSTSADDIVVTGTHVRGAPPTSQVIVLNRKDIERTGATSVDELIRTVPQNSQGGVNKENFLVALPDADPTDHGAGINLRGLGQRATLVLLNGRRLAPSSHGSFVDVSMIPVSAIERVEILTDGASAIYGSDAVGGVVNFVLRDRFEGLETTAQAGTTTNGGGTEVLLSQAAGKTWEGGHALLAYEFRQEDEVRAAQRPFTINLRPDTYLLPRERKHSLLGTVEQELAPRLRGGVTATFAHRATDRTVFQTISPLPVGVDAKATAATLSGELSYDLPHGWLARLDGNYGLSKTTQRQTQPGGIPLVNARDVRNSIVEGELHLDGPLVDLPAGAVRLAVGGDVRSEDYRDRFQSTSFAPTVKSARRTVTSAYGEILVPIFSRANRRPGVEALQLSAAARYDHYSGTGSSFDPKIGLLWSPIAGLKLRGSYSTSFRAPLLSEITGAYNALYEPAHFFYIDPTQAPPGSILLFLQGSNPDVKPETSRNWTLGADWAPDFAQGLKLTFNYYSIRYSNRIALPAPLVVVIGNPAFSPIVDFDPDVAALTQVVAGAQSVSDFTGPGFSNGGATPADVDVVLDDRTTNTSFTSTRGFDVTARYPFDLGPNRFVADVNLNHIIKFDNQLTSASPIIHALDTPYEPVSWRARAGLSWSRSGWNGSMFLNYTGAYRDNRTSQVRNVRSWTTVDANLSYQFAASAPRWLRGTRLSVFAENLFDSAPPALVPDPGSSTGLGYDPVNASAHGRFVAVQLRRSW
jgi:iron complex outermembrane receptor protein